MKFADIWTVLADAGGFGAGLVLGEVGGAGTKYLGEAVLKWDQNPLVKFLQKASAKLPLAGVFYASTALTDDPAKAGGAFLSNMAAGAAGSILMDGIDSILDWADLKLFGVDGQSMFARNVLGQDFSSGKDVGYEI